MMIITSPAEPRTAPPSRVTVIRAGAVRAAVGPALAVGYLLGTWGQNDRPVMLAVAGVVEGAGWDGGPPPLWPVPPTGPLQVNGHVSPWTVCRPGTPRRRRSQPARPMAVRDAVLPVWCRLGPRRAQELSGAAYWTCGVVSRRRRGYRCVPLGCGSVAYLCCGIRTLV